MTHEKRGADGSELQEAREDVVDALMQHHVFAQVLFQNHQDLLSADSEWFCSTYPDLVWSLSRASEEAIILRITQLADPESTGGKRNLTVRALPRLYPQLRRLPALVAAVTEETKELRNYRNKVLAHLDWDGRGRRPFGETFPEHAERSLNSILAVLNAVRETATAGYVVSGDPVRSLVHEVATLVNLGRTLETLAFGADGHSLTMTERSVRAKRFLAKLGLDSDGRLHHRLCLASATLQHYEDCPP